MELPAYFTALACSIAGRIEKPAIPAAEREDTQNDTTYMNRVIEALEARIAPAAVFTYTEADGDTVTVKTSAKVTAEYFESLASFDGGNLSELSLIDPIFQNTDLTITVKKAGGGNGKASIGYIEANVDLKNVIIKGDLVSISVGDSNRVTAPINKLQVQNLGGFDDPDSYFRGSVKEIKILGDFTGDIEAHRIDAISIAGSIFANCDIDAYSIGSIIVGGDMGGEIEVQTVINSVRIAGNIHAEAGGDGYVYADTIKSISIGKSILGGEYAGSRIQAHTIGNLVVGGDVIGGTQNETGAVWANEIGAVTIKGNVTGGAGYASGQINGYKIGSIRIGGDLEGGLGEYSGRIVANEGGTIDKVIIGGSIIGGTSYASGTILAYDIGSVSVGKSVVGGNGQYSGSVQSYQEIGQLRIGGDLQGGSGERSGMVDASEGGAIDKVVIGGSIIGDTGSSSGVLTASGIRSASIGKNIVGGGGNYSGSVQSYQGIGQLRIGGDLQGGSGERSGWVNAYEGGTIDKVVIGGSIIGDAGYFSGALEVDNIGSASIGRSILGGDGRFSGNIDVGSIGKVTVAKDVIGGAGENSGRISGYYGISLAKIGKDLIGDGFGSGSIESSQGAIGSVTIGGSLSNKSGNSSGIYANQAIGSVTINGSVTGFEFGSLGIHAGFDHLASSTVPAIGSVKIKGSVTNLLIGAGTYGNESPRIASIGSVNIGGDFKTSSIVAGVEAGADGFFGTADDAVAASASGVVSRIASVVIGKSVIGSPNTPNDSYGIIAQHIVELKVKGAKQTLQSGASNDLTAVLLGGTDDVRYVEVLVVPET